MASLKPYITVRDFVLRGIFESMSNHLTPTQMEKIQLELEFADIFAENRPPMFVSPAQSLWNQAVANNKVSDLMDELEKIVVEHIDWCGT